MKSAKWWMELIAAAVVLVAGARPGKADSEIINGVTWLFSVSENVAIITGGGPFSGALDIPSSVGGYAVREIGESAFYECTNLTSVVIPDSVLNIRECAFLMCNGITSVSIPNSVTNIGNGAFWYCKALKSVDIPDSVRRIETRAFRGCSGLSSITFGNSIESIEYDAFRSCSALTAIHIHDLAAWCRISFDGTWYTNPLYDAGHLYLDGKEITDLVLPGSVASVGNFANATGLATATIQNGTTVIRDSAFEECASLTTVTIPASVTNIGVNAFYNDRKLSSVALSDGLESIGASAFYYCLALTTLVIPDSVTSVGADAFLNSGLQKLYVPASWEGTALAANLGVSESVIVYGEPGKELVVFDANGGSCATSSQSYALGEAYGTLPEATRTHYAFDGWWTAASGGTPVTEASLATVEGKRTLYAHWTLTEQQVTCRANGGVIVSGGTSSSTWSGTFAAGKAYGTLPVPEWTHHAFDGWYTAAEGGERVQASDVVAGSDTLTLYAHWHLAEQVVTFNANGGSCATASRTYEVGGTYSPLPEATREKYTFAGWWTSSSGGTLITAGSEVSATETRTLYAHWTVAEQVVTFDANGGTCATATRTFEVGQTYSSLPMASRGEYTFAGWWTSASGGSRVDGTTVVTATETRTLYAHWTPINQVVAFNANGGSCATASRTYAVGQPYGELPEAERLHWAFAGWYTSSGSVGEAVTADSEVTPAETRTLYARWTLAEQVVAFDANGGVCAVTGRVYAADGTYAPLPEAVREGYAFAGWWSAAEGGTAVAEADMVSGGDTRTLHAHWTLAEQVVTFFENGGTCGTATRTYAVGSPYGWLPVAERAGVEFAGWYEWSGGAWVRVTAESEVTAERTRWLCALWKDSGVVLPVVEEYGPDPDGGGYMVRFTGAEGKTYLLQRTPNLEAGNAWSTVETLEADRDGSYQMAALRPSSWPKGFYRVVEVGEGDQWLESYLVVDMEGGPSAACWPVSVVSGAPDGGWSDEYKTTKLVLRLLAPDTFTMGSPYGELGREDGYYSYSGPETQHGVTLAEPFHIGVFEVTQKQWELATGNSPSSFAGATRPVETVGYADIRGSSSGGGWPGSDAVDSGSFLGVLRARTGLQFDLPTEAEWEYACRAGTTTALNSGKDLAGTGSCTNLAALGRYWYNRSEEVGGWAQHTAVGSYQPNAWGLYDMHGNVAEWCRDWYSSSVDSASVTNPVGPASGSYRANRGGSWTNSAQYCRSASRSGASPSERRDYRGLRVACPGVETYRVRFEANGGSGEMEGQRYVVGNDRLLPENAFVRAGYSFAGWATSATGEVAVAAGSGAAGLNASAGDNVALYAAWRPNAYGVRFDANDGTGTMDPQAFTYTVPQALTSNAFTRTGFVYKGWATNAGGDVVYADGATILNLTDEANGVVPLYAVWEPISYRIRFGANGGDGLMEDQVCFWDAPVELYSNAFTRPDYAFAGWATNASGDVLYGNAQVVSNLTAAADAIVPLYAQWYSYRVRFDANGGEGTMADQRFVTGVAQTLRTNAFNRTGYAFMGWATNPEGAVEYADAETVSDLTASVGGVVPLYAKWSPVYIVRFNANGGAGKMSDQVFTVGVRQALQPNSFKREGYQFAGWATSSTGEVEYADGMYVEDLATAPLSVVKLSAVWIQKKYLIVDMSGGADAESWPVSWLPEVPDGGWTDAYKTTNLVLRWISAGAFSMGSPADELGHLDTETQHAVTLTKPFYIGVFELTQRQWELVMGNRPSYFTNNASYAMRPIEQVSYHEIRGSSAGSKWPLTNTVDASSFFGVLRAKTGLAFDLPTEAQWEYACRAGTATAINSGKDLTDGEQCANMDEVGRYRGNSGYSADSSCDISAGTAEVGSYQPNAWGLYDMHGNVWEWCLDFFEGFNRESVVDPVGAVALIERAIRGGGWEQTAWGCRSATRASIEPSDGFFCVGFRTCCPARTP
ncbi:MAG: InlB B-repeat-containing protein [Kiritimatiellae bacterium]|nr:InlB B-repeat-containing protein [Kiritimatiellia bacterium]